MRSKWGGSETESSSKVVTSNLLKFIQSVGGKNIWNPGYVNRYLSNESNYGISLTTVLSRIQSFGHFINFLKIDFPQALPRIRNLDKIESIISGMKTTFCKERNSRQNTLMSNTRKNLPSSLKCLGKWRSIRKPQFTKILAEIQDCVDEPNYQLDILKYKRIRDFFIPELVIPNAQRPGIIQGILIEEILNGKILSLQRAFIVDL